MTDILNEVLAGLNPLSWWKNGVKDVLAAWLGVHWGQLLLFGTYKNQKVRITPINSTIKYLPKLFLNGSISWPPEIYTSNNMFSILFD